MLLWKVHYVAPPQGVQAILMMSRMSLRKKCPYSEFFWSVFSSIWIEYGRIRSISPYSAQMQEYTDQKNSEYGHFSHSVYLSECTNLFPILKKKLCYCLKSISLGISLLHSFNFSCISFTRSSNFYAGTSTCVPVPVGDSFNVSFFISQTWLRDNIECYIPF